MHASKVICCKLCSFKQQGKRSDELNEVVDSWALVLVNELLNGHIASFKVSITLSLFLTQLCQGQYFSSLFLAPLRFSSARILAPLRGDWLLLPLAASSFFRFNHGCSTVSSFHWWWLYPTTHPFYRDSPASTGTPSSVDLVLNTLVSVFYVFISLSVFVFGWCCCYIAFVSVL